MQFHCEETGAGSPVSKHMIRVPPELIAMVGLLVVLALGCTWTIRSDWRRPDGRIEWWGLTEAFVGLFLMLCMLVTSALQVLVRYLFSDEIDIPWTEEFGRLAMIWAAFWGAAMLQRADDHIRMSAVYDLLPAALQKAVRVFGDLLVLLVLAADRLARLGDGAQPRHHELDLARPAAVHICLSGADRRRIDDGPHDGPAYREAHGPGARSPNAGFGA